MGDLLARVLAIGAVAALVPVPIVVELVILAGPRGLARSWCFVLGFSGSLLAAGAVALFVTDASSSAPDTRFMSAVGLILGIAFLAVGAQYALRLRRGELNGAANLRLTGLTGARTAGLGVIAGALNPKTLPIFLTGVAVIALDATTGPTRSLALVLLTAVASVGVALPPLLLMLAPGEGTARALSRVRGAGERHAPVIATALLMLAGLAYAIVGVAGLR